MKYTLINDTHKRFCFACLQQSHEIKKMQVILKCEISFKWHFPVLCDMLESQEMAAERKEGKTCKKLH